ncbi:MAG: protein kinase domain-containing protein [Myxococcota bacterium]
MKATWFGRYLLLDKVAAGGMAEVWRAKITGESGFQRIIAVKKILPHVAEDAEFIAMFTDEANITVQLQHPNIGQVYEFSKLDDIYYIAMEYISGKDVKTAWSYMRQRKTVIPPHLSCYIVQKMAEGLSYAHNKRDNFGNPLGIVHRDVSPQNCLISWDGEVKVIDFGIAKADDKQSRTRAGTLKGKFAYMAPEQIRGLKLDGRADTFALGVVLYELLTGERGFQAESEFSLLEKVRNVEIKPPSMVNANIPPDLERIVFKALAKERDDRYLDAGDLAEDLQRYLLSQGKPPRANDLGEFLRQSFTVEYDKERLRLEAYKDIEVEPPPAPKPAEVSAPAATAPPAPEPFDPVKAAMVDDRTAAFAPGPGAFAAGGPAVFQGVSSSSHQRAPGLPTAVHGAGNDSRPYVISRPASDVTGVTPVTQVGRGFAPPMQRNTAPPAQAKGFVGTLKVVLGVGLGVILIASMALLGRRFLEQTGSVVVTVENALDATVRLDGVLVPQRASPSLTLTDVKVGEHSIIVEKDGYRAYPAQVIVQENRAAQLKVQLRRIGGRVRVLTQPPGAQLLLDGTEHPEKTPTTLEDIEGDIDHRIDLKLPGFKPLATNVKVKAGEEKLVQHDLQPAAIKLQVVSIPIGATVYVDGQQMGEAPLVVEHDPERAPPQVRLKKSGCEEYTTTVPLDAMKQEQEIKLTMKCR